VDKYKYTYSPEEYFKVLVKASAFLATNILNTCVRAEADAALALLGDHKSNKSVLATLRLSFFRPNVERDDRVLDEK